MTFPFSTTCLLNPTPLQVFKVLFLENNFFVGFHVRPVAWSSFLVPDIHNLFSLTCLLPWPAVPVADPFTSHHGGHWLCLQTISMTLCWLPVSAADPNFHHGSYQCLLQTISITPRLLSVSAADHITSTMAITSVCCRPCTFHHGSYQCLLQIHYFALWWSLVSIKCRPYTFHHHSYHCLLETVSITPQLLPVSAADPILSTMTVTSVCWRPFPSHHSCYQCLLQTLYLSQLQLPVSAGDHFHHTTVVTSVCCRPSTLHSCIYQCLLEPLPSHHSCYQCPLQTLYLPQLQLPLSAGDHFHHPTVVTSVCCRPYTFHSCSYQCLLETISITPQLLPVSAADPIPFTIAVTNVYHRLLTLHNGDHWCLLYVWICFHATAMCQLVACKLQRNLSNVVVSFDHVLECLRTCS
jgi:hypothetical protein